MRMYCIAVTGDLLAPLPFGSSFDSTLFERTGTVPVFDCMSSFVFLFTGIHGAENEID